MIHVPSTIAESRIVHGNTSHVARYMPERCAQIVFADPPYNIGIDYAGAPYDKLTPDAYRKVTEQWVRAAKRLVCWSGYVWWLTSEANADFTGELLTNLVGPRVNRVIWHERFSQYNHFGLTKAHRHLFVHRPFFSDEQGVFNPDRIREPSERMKSGDKRAAGPRIPSDVWTVSRLQGTSTHRVAWHPAQLPPQPLERIVAGWSNPDDLIVDLFSGSCSMGVVAVRLGRRFVGIDVSEPYATKAQQRLDAAIASRCTTQEATQ